MKALGLLLVLAASEAAAQTPVLSFDAWKSLPLTAGNWSYVATATGSEARFGTQLVIRCNRATRTVAIERLGVPPGSLTIATSSASRLLAAGTKLPATDPLLDAIAFSRGRFLVQGGGGQMLAVPSWPEAARSIEDCRN